MATNNLKMRGESVLKHSITQYHLDDSYHKTEQLYTFL